MAIGGVVGLAEEEGEDISPLSLFVSVSLIASESLFVESFFRGIGGGPTLFSAMSFPQKGWSP